MKGDPTQDDQQVSLSIIVYTLLVTLAFLIATRSFYVVWSPILGDVSLPTFSDSGGLMICFWVDLLAITLLMMLTGGAKESPFTSVLFLVPALAIFLRQPPSHFFMYAVYASAIYCWSLMRGVTGRKSRDHTAHGWVNLLCLGLTMLTGYITRPLPL